MRVCSVSHVQLFVTPRAVACQAPLSLGVLQARMLAWDAISSFQAQGSNPRLLHWQVNF